MSPPLQPMWTSCALFASAQSTKPLLSPIACSKESVFVESQPICLPLLRRKNSTSSPCAGLIRKIMPSIRRCTASRQRALDVVKGQRVHLNRKIGVTARLIISILVRNGNLSTRTPAQLAKKDFQRLRRADEKHSSMPPSPSSHDPSTFICPTTGQ